MTCFQPHLPGTFVSRNNSTADILITRAFRRSTMSCNSSTAASPLTSASTTPCAGFRPVIWLEITIIGELLMTFDAQAASVNTENGWCFGLGAISTAAFQVRIILDFSATITNTAAGHDAVAASAVCHVHRGPARRVCSDVTYII